MAKKKGVVSKAGKSKFGYFLMLDGEDFYYNTKFEPKCGEGDVVGVEFKQTGPSRGQINKVVVLTNNSGGYSSSNSERKGGGGGGFSGGGTGGSDRQDSIIWQSCQKVASSLVAAEVAAGALASKGNAESKAIEIKGRFDELTFLLFADASDPKNSKTYESIAKLHKDADGGGSSEDDNEWGDGDSGGDDDWSDNGDEWS